MEREFTASAPGSGCTVPSVQQAPAKCPKEERRNPVMEERMQHLVRHGEHSGTDIQ
jgi:hypothetical protein